MALAHSPSIVRSGLVLHLDAANTKSYPGSGTTWTDLSGNGRTGTLIAGPVFSSDNKGNFTLDGANDYVNFGDILKFASTSNLTISAWFKINNFSITNFIIARRNTSGTRTDYSMCVVNSTTIGYMYDSASTDPVSPQLLWNVPTMNTNSWYNCSLAILSNGTVNAFFNGSFISNATAPHGDFVSTEFTLGRSHLGTLAAPTYMQGSISMVSVYDRELTAIEIKKNFDAIRGRYET